MDNVWVVAFDKDTDRRMAFTMCQSNNAEFYRRKYEIEGYSVRVLDHDGIAELAEFEKQNGIM